MSTSKHHINKLHQSDLYLYFYESELTEERTKSECSFLEKACQLEPGDRVLDLACGHGRHANYLADRGCQVVGLDINEDFIQLARQTAEEKQLRVDYRLQDILEMVFEEEFDAAYLLFNAFGFFDKKDGMELLRKIFNALHEEGRVLIDLKNRDSILREIRPCILTEKNKDLMIDRLSFDPQTGTTTNNRIYIKDNQRYDAPFSMNVYHYTELSQMVESVGFRIEHVYGNWKGADFGQDSRRILLLLRKDK